MKPTTQLAAQICILLTIGYFAEPFMSLISGDSYGFALNLIFGIGIGIPLWLCSIWLRRSSTPAWWGMSFISAGGVLIGIINATGTQRPIIDLLALLPGPLARILSISSFALLEPFYGLRTAMMTFFPAPDALTGVGAFLAYGLVLVLLLLDLPSSRKSEATESTNTESADMGTGVADTPSTPPTAWALAVRIMLAAIATIMIVVGSLAAYIAVNSYSLWSGEVAGGIIRCITLAIVLTVVLIVRIMQRKKSS